MVESLRVRESEPVTERSEDTASPRVKCRLVLRGILPGDETRIPLDGQRWVIGRGSECNFRLERARVSREHAETFKRGPIHVVRDLGSTNGTHVNGKLLDQSPVAPGMLLRIGDWLGFAEEQELEKAPEPFSQVAPGVWGGAVLVRALQPLIRSASSSLPVVLVGRTGTGKERFARALHDLGGEGRPFHAINCATLSPALADAELFGYRKGAFTGAERGYAGRLRASHGGTLFLDEVADLPPPVQAKLLRALDSGELAVIGESRESRFEARVVAACQEPLEDLVARGRVREDLAARLSGLVIVLPSLRERRADVPALFETFLRRYSGGTGMPVSTRLYEALCLHDWPGNVRELELLARQLLAVHGLEPLLRRSHLPESLRSPASGSAPPPPSGSDRNERDVESLTAALKGVRGNVKSAAKLAGISRQRAYRLIGSRQLDGVVSSTRDDVSGGTNGRDE
jgi:DNA-binding NtrC family response regulator